MSMKVDYGKTISVAGDPLVALDALAVAFAAAGFRTVESAHDGFSAKGPGMRSTHESALRGASKVCVTLAGRQIRLEAELGGVRSMQQFLILFPPLLVFVIFGLIYLLSPAPPSPYILWIIVLWVVIDIFWVPAIRRATVREIDNLLESVASLRQRSR